MIANFAPPHGLSWQQNFADPQPWCRCSCRHTNLSQRASSHRSASSNERTTVILLQASQQFQAGQTPSSTLRVSDCN